MEFPDGIFLQFYDKEERIISTLKGNRGYFFNQKNFYRAEGDVHMINLFTRDELSSEELIWEPNDEKIRTEKFVTIKTEDEIHTGEGLIADQDFIKYKIIKPTGSISLEKENQPSVKSKNNN
jgi:LPS export ABC transporter protein LptC